ncbi:hypothetical protein M406DRAFT_268094, partial [Cryphonectria parasitica EP155]
KQGSNIDEQKKDTKWGFNIDDQEERFQWFKLEQDPKYTEEELRNAYPPLTIKPENELQARDLITEYLKHLRKHVANTIKESLDVGGGRVEALLKDVRWEYIITVPAMWPESAQNITEECAKNAGMSLYRQVQIIAEPEAAGIYALDQMSQELDMRIGDTFTICDAGGGTVDLISYTITRLKPSLSLDEATAGSGGLCGSSFLDRAFLAWLRGHVQGCSQWTQYHTHDAMVKWETETKRNFTGDTRKKYLIPARGIDDDRNLSIRKGNLEVPGKRVEEVFEAVISQILTLVQSQVSKVQRAGTRSVNAVLLAGGFGRNEYLRRKIQTMVGNSVKVRKMKDCTTAIVQGALIRVLADRHSPTATAGRPMIAVESRLARKHYGTKALQKFAPGHHDPQQPRFPGGVDGGERIDVMKWFIKKNTRVKDHEDMLFDFYYDQSVNDVDSHGGSLGDVILPIYICEDDSAPDYPDPDQEVTSKKLVELTANLNKIPKNKLKREYGADNQEYYKIDFKIVMSCHLANVTFQLLYDGVEYGSVAAKWDTK